MLKLYKQTDNTIHYWETWDKDEKTSMIHWGIVGQRGQDKEVKSKLFTNFRNEIQKEVGKRIAEGYDEIDDDSVFTLLIEFRVDGAGTLQDVEKQTKLQRKMDEILGWTGLGHCDGGSIGGGTMEVCCFVVDFDIAKKVIETSLADTEFADFSRIFDEKAEQD